MYHYVRNLPRTVYPKLKGMLLEDFCSQVELLRASYEMATVESALAFLQGGYQPARDLCLLTFDDGLKEHYRDVTPFLAERGIQGQFFLITQCVDAGVVAPVHMNHFLMAKLQFENYRELFLDELARRRPALLEVALADRPIARATYPWDTLEVASFKYFFNFMLRPDVRDSMVQSLFTQFIGPEQEFARELYVTWEEARAMQDAGMVMGGHSHWHRPLANLEAAELLSDLHACRGLLDAHLAPQPLWPFSYPYGKKSSFNDGAVAALQRLGFACAFSTERGANEPGVERFAIRRVDCKDVLVSKGRATA